MAENFHDYHVLARRDEHNIARLAQESTAARCCSSPISTTTSTTSTGLLEMHRYLFASAAERERLIAELVA